MTIAVVLVTPDRCVARVRAAQALRPILVALLLAGCATLTPAQSLGLREAQQLADEVTAHYGVTSVRVIADRDNPQGYWQQHNWITVYPDTLAKDDRLVTIAISLAPATLSYEPITHYETPSGLARLRQQRFTFNRRRVEIMVSFLRLTTREAVDHYATRLVAHSKSRITLKTLPRPTGLMLTHAQRALSAARSYVAVPPCQQLQDLWSHFAIVEPPPVCDSRGTDK